MKKHIFPGLIVAAVLGGCSMAPTHERPTLPVPDAFAGKTNTSAKKATDIGWKEFFKDVRLQAVIQTALENNRDLKIAALRIEESRALYGIQRADRLPTINAAADGSRARTPADLSSSDASTISTRYDVGVSLASYELDFFGRVKSLSDAALSTYLATEEAKRSAHISLVAEVAKAYLAERAFAEQYALAEKSYAAREESLKLAKMRFKVGATSALDLAQYESLMQSAKVSLVTLARQRAQAENALAVLTGKPLADLPPAQALSAQGVLGDIHAGLPSELLNNRPDLRQAEQKLMAANANIGAARAAFFPRIALTGSYGTASSSLSGLFESGSRAWSFAPQLVMPIFDTGRNINNLDLAWARKNIAVAEYEKAIQVAFREVADALVGRKFLVQQVDAQDAVMKAEAERLKLSEARYNSGISSSLDVLDAQRQLFSAEQALVQARLLQLTNSIDLYRSLGGGISDTLPFVEKK
ncbi:MAG: efflux transporter outer membrane subunit [Oxalobacter sp.]|nr:MAG: efflux transporter outer membrane subunit [Oxalobacter sp.]